MVFCLFSSSSPHLSGPSNAGWAGREFVLSFLQNYGQNVHNGNLELYITAAQANAKVTVKMPLLKFRQEKSLNAGESVTIKIPNRAEMWGSRKFKNTVLIQASADVTVTSFNHKPYTGDTSVVYPTTKWGKEYFIFTPAKSSYGAFKEFSVTNGKERNNVNIILKGTIVFMNRVHKKGTRMVINLQPYESVQFQCRDDLSGTRVVSKHPVAVVTGHTCSFVFSKCNHVYEQLLPVSSWGSSFIVPPVRFQTKYDSVFIQASQHTRVTVNKGTRRVVLHLARGDTKEIRYHKYETLSIQANHGIQVLMHFNGVTYNSYCYDPFLITVLPIDQFCSFYSITALNGFNNNALIVAQTSALAKMRFDGKNMPRNVKWKKVPGTDFSWAQMSYKQTRDKNIHTLSSSGSPFALYSIGFLQRDAYGSIGQCLEPGKVNKL